MFSHISNRPGEITLREMILAEKAISVLSCFSVTKCQALIYLLIDVDFLNTCSGRKHFLLASYIADLTTHKPIKIRVIKKFEGRTRLDANDSLFVLRAWCNAIRVRTPHVISVCYNGGSFSRAQLTFWLWRWIRRASKCRFAMWNMSVADEGSDDYSLWPPFLPRMHRGAFTKVLRSVPWYITNGVLSNSDCKFL